MKKSPAPTWWSRLRIKRRSFMGPRPPDFADLGTAFGLDASFGPIDDLTPIDPGDNLPASDRSNSRSAV